MNEIIPAENTGQLATVNESSLQPISIDDIDALDAAQAAPVDLMSDYWSPEMQGEFKRVIFDRIEITPVKDQATDQILELECAYFFEKDRNTNTVKRIRNGSKRLVGALQSFNIAQGTPLEIRYLGKKTNKTNQFKSDNWQVKPLIVNVTPKQ